MKRMNPHAGHGARHRMHHPDDLFDPREDGPGRPHRHGPGHGPGRRGRGGRRAPRGDVRTAILLLLEPLGGMAAFVGPGDRVLLKPSGLNQNGGEIDYKGCP